MTIAARCSARSFQETAPRNTAENTAKHRSGGVGGVGSVVANHRGGSESSVTVTTLVLTSSITMLGLVKVGLHFAIKLLQLTNDLDTIG